MAIRRGIISGIASFVTATVLSTVCLVYGFSPDEWMAGLITSPPLWLLHPLTKVGALLVGAALGAVAWWLWPWRSSKRGNELSSTVTGVDYVEWKGLDEIDLNTASAILAGTRDPDDVPRHLKFRALKQAIRSGLLAAHKMNGAKPNIKTTVKPVELKRYIDEVFKLTSDIKMTVGDSGQYMKTDGDVHSILRTYNLMIENSAPKDALSNCSIHIIEIAPNTDYEGPWLLQDKITVAAGAHVFVPLVSYREPRNPKLSGDSFAAMATEKGRPTLDIGPKYTATLRATALDIAPCEISCRIWIDDEKRLRIEEA